MTDKFKKIILESGSNLSPKQINLMFDIVALENKIVGMKLMRSGKKGFSSHTGDTLIFNEEVNLDELVGELG